MNTYIELVKIIVPSFISIIGFIVTIFMNKNNLQSELSRHHIEEYMNNYKNIEYDISEILQLTIKTYLGEDTYNRLEYIIQKHRTGEFALTDDVAERLYRLGGYVSTYGSRKSIFYLNNVRNEYAKYILKDCSEREKSNESDFCKFASSLAVLLLQIKQDIFNNKDYDCLNDEIDWLKTRLSLELYNKYENKLFNEEIALLQ